MISSLKTLKSNFMQIQCIYALLMWIISEGISRSVCPEKSHSQQCLSQNIKRKKSGIIFNEVKEIKK